MDIKYTADHEGIKTDADGWEHNFYTVTLGYGLQSMETTFRTGTGWTKEPTAHDVLVGLFLDADGAEYDFEDWANEFGLDPDSRKAYATWEACKVIAADLRELFGFDYDEAREAFQDR